MTRDLPPLGFEARMPHFRDGLAGNVSLHMVVVLAAAIGLVLGSALAVLFATWPGSEPLLRRECRVASVASGVSSPTPRPVTVCPSPAASFTEPA